VRGGVRPSWAELAHRRHTSRNRARSRAASTRRASGSSARRQVLDEQGARPLRAIVDYDEALMYARRGAPGDSERARPLLDAALRQFRTLGMPGWIRRAEALLKSGAAGPQESGGALR